VSEIELFAFAVGCGVLLLMSSRRFYRGLVYTTFSILMVGIVGYDPASILAPILLVAGIAFGHLSIVKSSYPSGFRIPALGFLLFSAASCVIGNPVWNQVIRLVAGIAFYVFIFRFIRSERDMRAIFLTVLIGTVASGLAGVLAIMGLWTPDPTIFFPVFQDLRFAGLYNATIMGVFTAILLIWLLDEIVSPKLWIRGRVVKAILLLLLLLQVLATLTRSAWLGLICGVLFYLSTELLSLDWYKRVGAIIGAGLILVGVFVLISRSDYLPILEERLWIETLDRNRTVEEERRASFYYTKQAVLRAWDHPLGLGLGQAGILGSEVEDLSLGAHNAYVHALADLGWVPGISLVVMLLYLLRALLGKAFRREIRYGVGFNVVAANMIVILVAGMFQDLILYIPMWLIPAIASVLIFGGTRGPLPA
jgi:O-antigen ligase